jgi:tryptophan synthase alpha chain
VPLILFTYFNPVLQMGVEKFADAASAAGADGVLATDLTPEEAVEYRATLHARGLDTIFLAAPTSTDARLALIAEFSSGFLYLISRTGVTGERAALPEDLPALARRVRKTTKLPLAVGFGISQPEHVSVLGGIADAAVVGSALMAEIEKARTVGDAVSAVANRIRVLKQAARAGISKRGSG